MNKSSPRVYDFFTKPQAGLYLFSRDHLFGGVSGKKKVLRHASRNYLIDKHVSAYVRRTKKLLYMLDQTSYILHIRSTVM